VDTISTLPSGQDSGVSARSASLRSNGASVAMSFGFQSASMAVRMRSRALSMALVISRPFAVITLESAFERRHQHRTTDPLKRPPPDLGLLGADLSASATGDLVFNFSGTDAGFFGFENAGGVPSVCFSDQPNCIATGAGGVVVGEPVGESTIRPADALSRRSFSVSHGSRARLVDGKDSLRNTRQRGETVRLPLVFMEVV
jgi:hypothetical protein